MSDEISCQVGCGTVDASLYSIREGQVGYASDLCFHQLRMTGVLRACASRSQNKG